VRLEKSEKHGNISLEQQNRQNIELDAPPAFMLLWGGFSRREGLRLDEQWTRKRQRYASAFFNMEK